MYLFAALFVNLHWYIVGCVFFSIPMFYLNCLEYRALWRFDGGDTHFENPYLAINVDMLHQADLGVFKTLVHILRSIAKEISSQILTELDERLYLIKDIGRFYQFRLPGINSGGFFGSNANFAAFEYRYVMQVSPII